jgi:hypothetical protein
MFVYTNWKFLSEHSFGRILSWPIEYKEVLEEMIQYMKLPVGRGIEEGSVMEEIIEKKEEQQVIVIIGE